MGMQGWEKCALLPCVATSKDHERAWWLGWMVPLVLLAPGPAGRALRSRGGRSVRVLRLGTARHRSFG